MLAARFRGRGAAGLERSVISVHQTKCSTRGRIDPTAKTAAGGFRFSLMQARSSLKYQWNTKPPPHNPFAKIKAAGHVFRLDPRPFHGINNSLPGQTWHRRARRTRAFQAIIRVRFVFQAWRRELHRCLVQSRERVRRLQPRKNGNSRPSATNKQPPPPTHVSLGLDQIHNSRIKRPGLATGCVLHISACGVCVARSARNMAGYSSVSDGDQQQAHRSINRLPHFL